MLSITRLLWVSGHINVSNPTLTPRSRFFHTLLLSLQVLQRATFRWQPSADDRSHPITTMLKEQRRTRDLEARKRIIYEFQRYEAEQQYYVYTNSNTLTASWQQYVKNYA